jgi:hypothetical protein
MAKTVVEKVASPNPDVSIFKVSGVLGYHENEVLAKFFGECEKKNLTKLIVDFTDLGSLGGGCAKIIREAAVGGRIVICVTGASKTVQTFLEGAGETPILYEPDVESGLAKIDRAQPQRAPSAQSHSDGPDKPGSEDSKTRPSPKLDGLDSHRAKPLPPGPSKPLPRTAEKQQAVPQAAVALQEEEEPAAAPKKKSRQAPAAAKPAAPKPAAAKDVAPTRDLERRLLQYRSLFSLNSDFSRIRERSRLLDAFLLTTIAQAGTESAAFLELSDESFTLSSWKGFETADPTAFAIEVDAVDMEDWTKRAQVFHVDEAPLKDTAKKRLHDWGMPLVAPFIVCGVFQGLVLLGEPIRKELDEATFDYLTILINQAAIAYQNSWRFEEESKRTLGLVQSLISMIEENTLSRGNTELIVNYVYAVAVAMHYPEEHVRDLIYGTVLRDIGMIKVSDLIVRSPRELQDEEWEIIKQHPIEGADMLRKMKFSEHTVNVVLYHHERFNSQGYPNRVQGTDIPLGARIVSVVESYAAMLQDRPIRPALSAEEAVSTLKENWEMRYDPDVVAKFVEIIEEEIRSGEMVKYEGSELFRD